MRESINFFIDLLLPPRCPVSGDIVDRQGAISPAVWTGLSFIEPPCCRACGLPFAFETDEAAECAACLAAPPVYAQARSALVYNDASRELVLAFKHGDKLESIPALVPMMRRAGEALMDKADIVIPVPLHRWRLLRRRYNQAALLAQALARQSGGKTVIVDALRRTRATPSQGHLNAGQRATNVKNAFAVRPECEKLVRDKIILLVDDVYTTGATLSECTKVLLKAGAAEVNVLTLARVVRAERIA